MWIYSILSKQNCRVPGGTGLRGCLDDGRMVIARPTSTSSGPTLEVQFSSNQNQILRSMYNVEASIKVDSK